MATLKKRKGKWYARIRKWDSANQIQIETQIPLRTISKSTALVRFTNVKRVEKDIKAGMRFTFPWLNESRELKLVQKTIAKAFDEFIKAKTNDGLEISTIERYKYSIKSLYEVLRETFPLARLNHAHIDQFKAYWSGRHDPTTINTNLTKIRTFIHWCVERGYIKNPPRISKIKDIEKPIAYLTDSEFNAIMNLDKLENQYKRIFLFYRETGCRLSEPFLATIDGNWLTIQPDKSKTNRKRELELSGPLLTIYKEMMMDAAKPKPSNPKYGNVRMQIQKTKSITNRYSRVFRNACKEIGIRKHKFHNLRDTYAVRLWAITGDIHYVSKAIGHTSVTMTEKYANFNIRRIIDDFPSISHKIIPRLERAKNGIRDTDFRDTLIQLGVPLDDKTK